MLQSTNVYAFMINLSLVLSYINGGNPQCLYTIFKTSIIQFFIKSICSQNQKLSFDKLLLCETDEYLKCKGLNFEVSLHAANLVT